MKSIIVSLCFTIVAATAAERKFVELLQPGKRCVLTLAGGSQVKVFSGDVTILEVTTDGWVKVEYVPTQQSGRAAKLQTWVNLSHVVFVDESSEFPAK